MKSPAPSTGSVTVILRIAAIIALAGAATLVAAATPPPASQKPSPYANALAATVAAPTRTEANRARDRYRHPYETLTFFGVKPGDTVVEIWPGGGWYTEVLAPYLHSGGGKL